MLRFIIAMVAFASALQAQTTPNEMQVKAVFLLHMAQFVEWPPDAFLDQESPLVIGLLGDAELGTHLDEAVAGETVNRRPLAVHRYSGADDIVSCHILFIGREMIRDLGNVLTKVGGRPVLTVGDDEDFAVRGGVVQFLAVKGKTRFRVNLSAARAAKLSISSKFLRVADVIAPATP